MTYKIPIGNTTWWLLGDKGIVELHDLHENRIEMRKWQKCHAWELNKWKYC